MSEKTITIVVPAFNEEKNISLAVDSVSKAVGDIVEDYEIIVIDDGSSDRTGTLAKERAKDNPHVKVEHNERNSGYGYCYQKGVRLAKNEYIGVFPGDNDMAWESLRDLVSNIGEADVITSYMRDMKRRPVVRRVISRCFTFLMNSLFSMRLKYFNGSFICKRALVQSINVKATSLIVIAECLVRLIKSGASYKEICFIHIGRTSHSSKALYPKSVIAVVHDVFVLWKDITFKKSKA